MARKLICDIDLRPPSQTVGGTFPSDKPPLVGHDLLGCHHSGGALTGLFSGAKNVKAGGPNDMKSPLEQISRTHGGPQLTLRLSRYTAEVADVVLVGRRALEQSLRDRLDSLEQEPTWGTVWAMLERAGGHVDASVLLMGAGQFASAEALSRVASETSVNVLYTVSGDCQRRLHDYFSSHVRHEREDCAKWSRSIHALTGEARAAHEREIAKKVTALDHVEGLLSRLFSDIGVSYSAGATWPSVYDRYAATVGGISYRTAYAAMCAQVHNDAEGRSRWRAGR